MDRAEAGVPATTAVGSEPREDGNEPRDLPELRLALPDLEHNVRLMADWCRARDVALSPHIKTTMTRPVVERQLAAGAWGVTVATARQADIAIGWGVRRVLVANQVVHRPHLALLRRRLDAVSDLELYCFVDSAAGLDLARSAMAGARNPLRVLVDVGAPGGRTGVRDPAEAVRLGRAAAREGGGLLLAGVAGYEGVRPNRRDPETLAAVDAHIRTVLRVGDGLAGAEGVAAPLLSMGGSAFPDRVVDALAGAGRSDGRRALAVLRSGCYVTHDHGTYRDVSPLPGLRPALAVRAVVLSTPEPGLAVVGAGRREVPHDAGLPVLLGAWSADGTPRAAARGTATAVYDHHLVLGGSRDLHVGDEVDLGVSHPCSAFDRWPDITVVDGSGRPRATWHPRFR